MTLKFSFINKWSQNIAFFQPSKHKFNTLFKKSIMSGAPPQKNGGVGYEDLLKILVNMNFKDTILEMLRILKSMFSLIKLI